MYTYSVCLIWCRVFRSRDVHPCYMVSHCPVSRCPPLISGAALSDLRIAMSTPAIWCRIVRSRVVHPCIMVSHCPVLRCQSQQFWWSRDVQFRVFSRPPWVIDLEFYFCKSDVSVAQSHPRSLVLCVCDFLLVRNSKLCPFLQILQVLCASDPTSIPPCFWGVPVGQDRPCWGQCEQVP